MKTSNLLQLMAVLVFVLFSQAKAKDNTLKNDHVKVTFGSLTATKVLDPTITVLYDSNNNVIGGQLHGGVSDAGSVTVAPSASVSKVEIRLVQYLNSLVGEPGNSPSSIPKTGDDTAFDAYSTTFTVSGSTLNISSSDGPGPALSNAQWALVPPNSVTMDANFNLYLQWHIKGSSDPWKTVGKVTWSVHMAEAPTIDGSGNFYFHTATGSVSGGTGAASTETPTSPSSHS